MKKQPNFWYTTLPASQDKMPVFAPEHYIKILRSEWECSSYISYGIFHQTRDAFRREWRLRKPLPGETRAQQMHLLKRVFRTAVEELYDDEPELGQIVVTIAPSNLPTIRVGPFKNPEFNGHEVLKELWDKWDDIDIMQTVFTFLDK